MRHLAVMESDLKRENGKKAAVPPPAAAENAKGAAASTVAPHLTTQKIADDEDLFGSANIQVMLRICVGPKRNKGSIFPVTITSFTARGLATTYCLSAMSGGAVLDGERPPEF